MTEAFTKTGEKIKVELLGAPCIASRPVLYEVGKRKITATRLQRVYAPSLRTRHTRTAIQCVATGEWYIL